MVPHAGPSSPEASRASAGHDGARHDGAGPESRGPVVSGTERLHAIATALSRPLSKVEVLDVILRQTREALGASAGVVMELTADGTTCELLHAVGVAPEVLARFTRVPADAPLPLGDALRLGHAVVLDSMAEWLARYPQRPTSVPPGEDRAWAAVPLQVDGATIGALTLEFAAPRRFAADDVALLDAFAAHCALALERARLFEAERAARERSERTAELTRQLQAMTAALSAAATVPAVAQAALERGVAAFRARSGSISLLDDGGDTFDTLASVGYESGERVLWRRYPAAPGTPGGDVVRSLSPVFLESSEEWAARYPAIADEARRNGMIAAVGLPLVVDGARCLGAIGFSWDAPRRFSPEERELLPAFASAFAQALDRARLYAAEQRARRRTEHLQELTAALAAAESADAAADVLLAVGGKAAGAFAGTVAVIAPADDQLAVLRAAGYPADLIAPYARIPLDAPLPPAYAARTGEPVFLLGDDEWRARFAPRPDMRERLHDAAWAALPLRAGDRLLGVWALVYHARGRFDAEEREYLLALAAQGAQALERARLREEERAARAAAESASRAKSEFLAVMSHELRTPLNAIGGYAELLELGVRGPLTEPQRADIGRIQASQRHLLGLINEVLNYARVESGAVRYDVAEVPIAAVIASVEPLVRPQLRARGLRLDVGPCDADVVAWADHEKVRQILLNLLSNAIKFTDAGGHITIRCEALATGRVRVHVADTGIGIAPEKHDAIFDPFVQVNASLTRTRDGTGLGLAISRDLARGMDGELTVQSALGAGSTFTLTLPIARG